MPNSPFNIPVLHEDLPLYPPLLQLIRVTATTVAGPAGVAQTAGSSVLSPTLYVAFTQQLRTDGLLPRDREPCLADDVEGAGLVAGYYLGRLAGSHNSLPVYEVTRVGSGSNVGVFEFAKNLGSVFPDANGRYQARLQVKNADGTLSDTGAAIWLREAQNMGRLHEDAIYPCSKTGFANTRDVYTVADFDLSITNQSFTEFVNHSHYFIFGPDRCWSITATDPVRSPLLRRLLNVRETSGTNFEHIFQFTFDPATNWEIDDNDDDGDVKIQRVLTIREGTTSRTTFTWQVDFDSTDFDVAATATGHATVNTEGATEAFYVLSSCTAGVLKRRLLTFTRGLLKSVGAEIDA